MKKLIGIILAICMLSTMAFAATTPSISDKAVDQSAMTVSFKYANIAADGQATMLAYEVTSLFDENAVITEETKVPDYQNEQTTPIKGIDQNGVDDKGFSFKVAEGYEGIIAVKIGGTGIDTPAAFLVEFKKVTVDPDPEEPEVPTYTTVTVYCGDVNGDNVADGTDADLIFGSTVGGSIIGGGKYNIGETITVVDGVNIVCGDVNGDEVADGTDADLIFGSTVGGSIIGGGKYNIGAEITFQVEVTPEA